MHYQINKSFFKEVLLNKYDQFEKLYQMICMNEKIDSANKEEISKDKIKEEEPNSSSVKIKIE